MGGLQKLFQKSCPRQSVKHEVAHGQIDHCFSGTGMVLVIFTQASIVPEPGKGAFYNPAFGQDFECRRAVPFLDDVDDPSVLLMHPFDKPSFINSIGPDTADPVQRPAGDFPQHPPCPIAVLHIGGMHHHGPDQSEGVDEQVSFPSLYAFACIVAARPPFCVVFTDWLSRINALGVQFRPSC